MKNNKTFIKLKANNSENLNFKEIITASVMTNLANEVTKKISEIQ